MLQALGISADAADVYLALAAEPSVGLAELAAQVGLTERQAGEAVAQLARLGLIESAQRGDACSVTMLPADPELALAALMRRQEAEVARRQQELADTRAAVAAAAAAYRAGGGHPERCARPVASELESLDLARQLIGGAIKECVIADADPARILGPDGAQVAELASSGARVAIICADATRSSSASASLADLERAGAQVRTLPCVAVPLLACGPPPLALLWPGAPDDVGPAVLARDPVFARAVAGIFDSHWGIATPLQQEPQPDPVTGLTPADQALLSMLAAGLTGEAAARRLGTSLTTVRRQMSRLKDALQADSLFEAGYLAARRGWV